MQIVRAVVLSFCAFMIQPALAEQIVHNVHKSEKAVAMLKILALY